MTSPRITVPTLFDGGWDSVLICTYGANLAFYERDLWRQLERARNRVIFADGRQIARKFSEADGALRLRQVNRTYVLAPMEVDHAAHAKLILLLREERGLLAVGSGNLGMDGYASQGECFTTYTWTDDRPEHLNAFRDAKAFIAEILDRGLVDDVIRPRVQQAWQDAPWIYGPSTGEASPVRHNLDRPLIDQFIETIGDRPVEELVVHAPFYDHQCRALTELLKRTEPRQLQVLLQERITSVNPTRLSKILLAARCAVDVRSVQAQEKGTFLHAKFVIARCADVAVCLQGSANLSTPALLHAFPAGNIELANLLVGGRSDFDHLVSDLIVSPEPVEVAALGLSLATDEDDGDEPALHRWVRELSWVPPRLSGRFDCDVTEAPTLIIGEETVEDVRWELHEPVEGTTRFTATLGDSASVLLARVEAITFVFGSDASSIPAYPYHLNTLIALASGQSRTDLLKQTGDFDLGDEELEQLLAQLDEVLLVDGRSIWRMLKRKLPDPPADGDASVLSYSDLDWPTIQSHPKLAQYRTWDQPSAAEPSGLGILLSSIAQRFHADVKRRRSGTTTDGGPPPVDPLEDLSRTIDAEDEEAAEAEDTASERRRATARARAKRQFQSFVKRFVTGIKDDEFVRLVGPSVIVPSYVIFNHLCWKLIQVDLADPLVIVHSQVALWRFFWGAPGEPGYFATMTTEEQEAALDILDRHHAEAVLLCSLFQAYDVACLEGFEADVTEIRDAWRCILDHPLWQPTKAAVMDAATVLVPVCPSAEELVEYLDGLASYLTAREPLQIIERCVGARAGSVSASKVWVRRAELGNQHVTRYVIDDPTVRLTQAGAEQLLCQLRGSLPEPESNYIRVEAPDVDVVVFADYATENYVYADRSTSDIEDLERPEPVDPRWRQGLDELYQLAG